MEILQNTPLADFAIALFIGALVGIEREKKLASEPDRGVAGLRTFILLAEAGAVAGWLSNATASPSIFVAGGTLVAAVVIAGYAAWVRTHPRDIGLTTEIAALLVYLLGGLVTYGHAGVAVALAIATSAVLAFKQPLHAWVGQIGRDDLYAGIELLIATFIVLPVLPNHPVDPWGALNPYSMWWLVVLISGLSLLGYVATRWLGSGRGVPLTGCFGGLVSSTAVTLSFARRSRERPDDVRLADSLAAGILIAWAVMFVRIGVMVAVIQPQLLASLGVPLAVLAGIAALAAGIAHRRAGGQTERAAEQDVPLTNPFSLTAATRFAALFALVLLAVRLVETYAPGRGVYGVAALAGSTDVDAITLSMATAVRSATTPTTIAAGAIVVASISNTLTKFGLALAIGSRSLARRLGLATLALLVSGAVALLL